MIKIGITGGIGSGKTTVCKLFELLKVPVLYADDVGKNLMMQDPSVMQQIKQTFGDNAYMANGLNRNYIANIVFNDPKLLAKLNGIVHPAILKYYQNWTEYIATSLSISQLGFWKQFQMFMPSSKVPPMVMLEAAILFESGFAQYHDYNILVYAPQELRIERVMDRDKVGYDSVLQRISNQMKDEDKISKVDFVIYNDEKKMLIPQVLDIYNLLLAKVR